jgi:hypothetical protein
MLRRRCFHELGDHRIGCSSLDRHYVLERTVIVHWIRASRIVKEVAMNKNVGTIDKVIRIILGIVLMIVAFTTASTVLKVVLFIIGLVALVTALSGFCLLYKLLGVNTCKTK